MFRLRPKKGIAAVIGNITDGDSEIFEYNGETVATIPNNPSAEILAGLKE